MLVLTFSVTVLPKYADAFWPFSSAIAAPGGLVPSSSTEVLKAVTNFNTRSGAGAPLPLSGDRALVSYSGPAGSLADRIEIPESDRISVYVVRPGDTLSDIARMFDVSVNTIIWANNLKNTKDVHPGDTLVILPISGVRRTVAKGDTLNSLAKKYSSEANEIAQYNGLDPAVGLVVGSTIIIPGGEVTLPAPKKSSGSSTSRYAGTSAPAQSGYFSNPVPGGRVTQGIHGHNGVDFGAARGTPIHAAADGKVIISRGSGWNGGYGIYVVISHANGTQTLYAHMTSTLVSSGQNVSRGQTIGYVGNTGKSTGNHLHFEVRGSTNPFAR